MTNYTFVNYKNTKSLIPKEVYRRYRLRTCDPTRFVETLDYDIECPHCHDQLRLCGMAVDAMTHGLYRCKRCDDEAERRR